MHTQFLIHITICIELLVFLAGLSFLAKAVKESYGKIYTILACLTLTTVALVLVCTLWAGFSKMCRHHEKGECTEMEMEKCMKVMGGHKMMMGGGDCDEMPCCKEMKGCKDMEKEECPYDKNGKCMGDEKKCKMDKEEAPAKDTVAKKAKK